MTPTQKKQMDDLIRTALSSEYLVPLSTIQIDSYTLDDEHALKSNTLTSYIENNNAIVSIVVSDLSYEILGESYYTPELILNLGAEYIDVGFQNLHDYRLFDYSLS